MKKILILATVLLVLTGCFGKKTDEKDKKKKDNTEIIEITKEEVIQNKEYDGIKIENISFNYDGKYTNMTYTIINSKEIALNHGLYDVIVNDANGNELGRFEGYLAEDLEPNASLEMTLSLDKDFSKASSVEFDFSNLIAAQ